MKASTAAIAGITLISILVILYLSIPPTSAQSSLERTQNGSTIRIQYSNGTPLLDLDLLDNTAQCLIDCSAILRLHPYQDLALPATADSSIAWEFVKADSASGLSAFSFELLQNVTTTRRIPVSESATEYRAKPANESIDPACADHNATHISCTIQRMTGSVDQNDTHERFMPFSFWNQTLRADRDYTLRLVGKKRASLGANDIDWIPTFHGLRLDSWNWWNGSWQYRKQINITDLSNTSFTDYPVVAAVSCGAACNSTGADLRLVANDVQELPFGLQSNATAGAFNLSFWANVTQANGTNSSYYLYYGNSNALAANQSWNRSRYNFYADFEPGSPNVTAHNGSFTVQDGTKYAGTYALKGNGTGTVNGLATFPTWNVTDTGILAEAVKFDAIDGVASWDGFVLLATPPMTATSDTMKNTLRAVWSGENDRIDHSWFNASGNQSFVSTNTGCSFGGDSWHLHQAAWFRNNRTLFSTASGCTLTTTSISPMTTGEPSGAVGLYTYPSGTTYFDNIAFRKLLVPEPVVTMGSQETKPTDSPATEAEGLQAIKDGIDASVIAGASRSEYQQVVTVNTSGNQSNATFDLVAEAGSQTWAFNYVTAGEAFASLSNISTVFYTLELQNMTAANIQSNVTDFINRTKV